MNKIVMSNRFLKAYNFMRVNEGGFSDNKSDKGGATIYGISSKWFPEVYNEVIEAKLEEVDSILKAFYNAEFWNDLYDEIYFEPLSIRLFDLSVNISKKKAVKLLQKTFNELSTIDIGEDGNFGTGTLQAINHPPIVHPNFYMNYLRQAEAYYKSLADFGIFGKGWINRLKREIV